MLGNAMNPSRTQPTTPDLVCQFLGQVGHFARRHGGDCYHNWSPETLRDYFLWHLQAGTLAWCRCGDQVVGVGVAWQTHLALVQAAERAGRLLFDWTPSDPEGDVVFVADFVCTQPNSWMALARGLAQNWPAWASLPAWTYRHNRLIQLNPRLIRRVFQKGT